MITTGISGAKNLTGELSNIGEDEIITIEYLSKITGFPEEFIQDELMIKTDNITLKHLRENMLNYLETFTES